MTAIPLDKIEDILQKGKSLEEQLGKENTSEKFVELSKEYSEIQPLYESVVEWKNIYIEISDLKNLLEELSPKPAVLVFIGVNGSGKTTTIGKIAKQIPEGDKILM